MGCKYVMVTKDIALTHEGRSELRWVGRDITCTAVFGQLEDRGVNKAAYGQLRVLVVG